MKTSHLLYALLSVSLVVGCAGNSPSRSGQASAPRTALQSGVFKQNMDPSVRPQDDFYRFVNGNWLAVTPIPADRSNYGAFTLLQEGAERNLRQILEESASANAPVGSDAQKVGDFYASFMDEAAIEAKGLAPLQPELERIGRISSKKDIAEHIGRAQRQFVNHPFAFFVAIDEKNSTRYIGTVYQTGLGMPDRDYYLSDEESL